MSDMRQTLINFAKDQITVQNKIADIYREMHPQITNKLVSEAVEWMSIRAHSHAVMFQAMLTIAEEEQGQFISEELREQLITKLNETKKYQNALIKALTEIMPRIQKERVANTLKWLLTDLRREHRIINQFTKVGLEEETLTNETLWKLLWMEGPEDEE